MMSEAKRDKKVAGDEAPLPWLAALEARVRDAVERLREAGTENAALRRRLAELQGRLDEANAGAAPPFESDKADRAAWHEERDEVRRRVDHLTETLAALLDEHGS